MAHSTSPRWAPIRRRAAPRPGAAATPAVAQAEFPPSQAVSDEHGRRRVAPISPASGRAQVAIGQRIALRVVGMGVVGLQQRSRGAATPHGVELADLLGHHRLLVTIRSNTIDRGCCRAGAWQHRAGLAPLSLDPRCSTCASAFCLALAGDRQRRCAQAGPRCSGSLWVPRGLLRQQHRAPRLHLQRAAGCRYAPAVTSAARHSPLALLGGLRASSSNGCVGPGAGHAGTPAPGPRPRAVIVVVPCSRATRRPAGACRRCT